MKVTKPMIERGAQALAEAMGIDGPEPKALVPLDFEDAASIILEAALNPKPELPVVIDGQTTIDDFLEPACLP